MSRIVPKEKSSVRSTLSWLSHEEKGLRLKTINSTSTQGDYTSNKHSSAPVTTMALALVKSLSTDL